MATPAAPADAPDPPAPAKLPEPGDPDVLYVIDVSGYVHRAYHVHAAQGRAFSTSKGEPTFAVLTVSQMLLKLLQDQRPGRLAIALDSKASDRKERYPKYKENRSAAPPDLFQQFERVLQIADAFGIPRFEHDGAEADDVIATIVRLAREQGWRVVLVGADKDLLQLVGDDVVMYDTMYERLLGPAETRKKLGVPPAQVRDYLALVGDTSDNVPGVPSVGPKTAAQLLEAHGDLDGIYEHLDSVTKKSVRAKLTDHRDDAFLSRELVTLRDDLPLSLDADTLAYDGGDQERLRALFRELEMTRLLEQLEASVPSGPVEEAAAVVAELVTSDAGLRDLARDLREAGRFSIQTLVDDPLRDPIVGLVFARRSDEAFLVPTGGPMLKDPVSPERLAETLGPVLADGAVGKSTDDVKRDLVALRRLGLELDGPVFDTMLASYLVDPERHGHGLDDLARGELRRELPRPDRAETVGKGRRTPAKVALATVRSSRLRETVGPRCAALAEIADALRRRLADDELEGLYEDVELPLARVLARMEDAGIRLDSALLEGLSTEVTAQIRQLEARSFELAGHEFNVGSPRQLETVLFDELGLPVLKRTKTARSTDHEVLEDLSVEHELPAVILEHRQLSKLQSTYLEALPAAVDPTSGRVHTRYNQAVAATGRLSSSDPNLQNIPIRTELGRRIRHAFVPREGWRILAADYSQIELRLLAHLSQDAELVDAYTTGEDVHVRTATALFEVAPEEVTREQRGQAKTVNFAVIYGQTQFALARNLRIERREAKRYIDAFFTRYEGVRRFMEETIDEAKRTGETRTILGRRRRLPDLQSRNRTLRGAAERMARNTPIQGSAADIMKLAMVAVQRRLDDAGLASRMLLTVHDELVFEAPPEEVASLETLVRKAMVGVVEMRVPLEVDVGVADTWGDAH